MLKPIDKGIEIQNIRLLKKTGGKSARKYPVQSEVRSAIVVCSDSVSGGSKTDKAGLIIQEKLNGFGLDASNYSIIPDEIELLQAKVNELVKEEIQLIVVTGGTGVSPRDTSPEAILPLLERRMPGIEEAIRSYGQQRTPYAMLSRSLAGFIGESLVLVIPGSTNGASESIDAVFPAVLHIFDVLKAFKHDV
jgi:molybdenum cofactor synthesis domain-containing protein